MTRAHHGLLVICAALILSPATRAQVSVAGVTRISGLYAEPSDQSGLKEINRFLSTLESDLAAEITSQSDVQYKDRTSTEELFRELRLSSSASFDAGSGALRGLLGRLDLIVVIDGIDKSTARMRLVDVETGSVRGIETCHKPFTFIGSSGTRADCVAAMAKKIYTAARPKALKKIDSARVKQEATEQAFTAATAAQKDRAAADARLSKKLAVARAEQAKAELASQAAARQDNADMAKTMQQILSLKPSWDEACAVLASAEDQWSVTAQRMAAEDRTLRPEIRSLLRSAAADTETGKQAIQNSDVSGLRQAIASLRSKLKRLDDYR